MRWRILGNCCLFKPIFSTNQSIRSIWIWISVLFRDELDINYCVNQQSYSVVNFFQSFVFSSLGLTGELSFLSLEAMKCRTVTFFLCIFSLCYPLLKALTPFSAFFFYRYIDSLSKTRHLERRTFHLLLHMFSNTTFWFFATSWIIINKIFAPFPFVGRLLLSFQSSITLL